MTVSVVIATRNGGPRIGACLDALAQQTRPADEILVVDDGSQDDTAAVVAAYSGLPGVLRLVQRPPRGPAAARNTGIAEARGDFIAFTDDDCLPQPAWLAGLLAAMERTPDAPAVFGRTVPSGVVSPMMHFPINEGLGHQTCNALYRTKVLKQVGGFDEIFPFFLEDSDLYYRVSKLGTTCYAADALVVHPARPMTVLAQMRKAPNYVSEFLLYDRHPVMYRQRRRGCGPLLFLVYYLGVKHFVARAVREFPWVLRTPGDYLRLLAGLALERVYLFWLLLTGQLQREARRRLAAYPTPVSWC